MNLLNLALAILLPPVGVFLTYGIGPTLFESVLQLQAGITGRSPDRIALAARANGR